MALEPVTAAAVLLAGALIGATGIGGVLVVPALAQLEGTPLPQAIATSAAAFSRPGALALWWLHRAGGWNRSLAVLLAAALPSAAAGAFLVHRIDVGWLLLGLGALALASGARGLARPADAPVHAAPLSLPASVALGVAVGAGSALTGTGGPVLLVPILLLLRQPLALTVAAAQAIQLPIAVCAAAAHAASGALDWRQGLLVGLVLLAASVAGRRLAAGWSTRRLAQAVSALLLAVGAWYAWRAVPLFLNSSPT